MDSVAELARVLRRSSFAVTLTGAGISAASGVPTFRAGGGIWERFPVEEYGTATAFERDPERCWELFGTLARELEAAAPNPAHAALAELERRGLLHAVITQNVDGLHQRAGSRQVVEYHGSASSATCPRCRRGFAADELAPWPPAPRCPGCGAVVRPDVVLFGDPIPHEAAARALELAARTDLLLVVGSALEVAPASWLAADTADRGADVAVVDPRPSLAAGAWATVVVPEPAETALPRLLAALDRSA